MLYNLEIGFPQAALGTKVTVPTFNGSTTVKIDHGTQPGEIIKLRGRGMPCLRGYGKGDLLIRVNISVPKRLTKKQKNILKDLAREG